MHAKSCVVYALRDNIDSNWHDGSSIPSHVRYVCNMHADIEMIYAHVGVNTYNYGRFDIWPINAWCLVVGQGHRKCHGTAHVVASVCAKRYNVYGVTIIIIIKG